MLYIELKSKIAEEKGKGHTIMCIYEGKLVGAPFLNVVDVSRAFIVYHSVKDNAAKILKGHIGIGRIGFPDPRLYAYKNISWDKLRPYFESLSEGKTENQLSIPEFRRFLHCSDLEKELSNVPNPEIN